MEITFTKEDIELVEKFIDIKNRGYYADGGQVTSVYNRILHKNVNVTNCGSCLRGRIQELEAALNHFKELTKRQEMAQEALKEEQSTVIKEDENKATDEPKNEPTEKKRVGRPKKSE